MPIIQLFKRLVTSDNKENTVLTNAQIIEILNKEFDIKLSKLHELECDIYITVLKKYLKDWPQWDEFECVVSNIKGENKNAEMEKIFESKYLSLKSFLKGMLDIAEKIARPTVQTLIDEEDEVEKKNDKSATSENSIVLEIHGSRKQLNQLIFRRPHPNLNNTVFNPKCDMPKQIQLATFPIEAILNWWGVSISVMTTKDIIIYKRETKHELKHVLVNKNLKEHLNPCKVLDQDIKVSSSQNTETVDVSELVEKFDPKTNNNDIYMFIKKDLEMMPPKLPSRKFLKRYTNKYTYVRYLYKDVDVAVSNESNKYDLQLEETVSPCYHTYLGRVKDPIVSFYVCCTPCEIKFEGPNLIDDLKSHFDAEHINEPDWTCTNCNDFFPMVNLAKNYWCHRC